jgi:hypothetical protein
MFKVNDRIECVWPIESENIKKGDLYRISKIFKYDGVYFMEVYSIRNAVTGLYDEIPKNAIHHCFRKVVK